MLFFEDLEHLLLLLKQGTQQLFVHIDGLWMAGFQCIFRRWFIGCEWLLADLHVILHIVDALFQEGSFGDLNVEAIELR